MVSDARKRAPALVLRVESTARDVSTATGNHMLPVPDGAGILLTAVWEYFAPDAVGAAYQDVVKFSHSRDPAPTMGGHLVEFDLRRRQPDATHWLCSANRMRVHLVMRSLRFPPALMGIWGYR